MHTDTSLNETFRIRCYSKSELASLYFPGTAPDVASQRLRRWINRCAALKSELLQAGYQPRCRSLSPREVRLIVYYLGEP